MNFESDDEVTLAQALIAERREQGLAVGAFAPSLAQSVSQRYPDPPEPAPYEPLVIDETDTIAVPRVVLQGIYDLASESPFLGSGYWDREDHEVHDYVAELLGVEPEKEASYP